jgi:hypothetical protein
MLKLKRYGSFKPGKRWWGLEFSTVLHDDSPYLQRWIVYLGGFTLRLHKFHRGDDDRAPHDHPWWFITFPFRSYEEVVPEGGVLMHRVVKAFRFHYRPATYQHIVKMPPGAKPFFTFVISGQRSRGWGFWPSPTQFIDYKEWV